MMAERDRNQSGFALVIKDLARIFGAGASPEECTRFLKRMLADEGALVWRISSITGLADSLRGRSDSKITPILDPLAALVAPAAT
jgi:hypothetical protein